eukprot:595960-Prymnesium_polylepis.1
MCIRDRCVTRARGARCGVARRECTWRVPRRGDRARGRAARARREGAHAARGRRGQLYFCRSK